jgi:hypothetical protein
MEKSVTYKKEFMTEFFDLDRYGYKCLEFEARFCIYEDEYYCDKFGNEMLLPYQRDYTMSRSYFVPLENDEKYLGYYLVSVGFDRTRPIDPILNKASESRVFISVNFDGSLDMSSLGKINYLQDKEKIHPIFCSDKNLKAIVGLLL